MKIRLLLATEDGTVFEVADNIQDYDLTKPMAASALANEIRITLRRIDKDLEPVRGRVVADAVADDEDEDTGEMCENCGGSEGIIQGCEACCRDCGRPCSFEKDGEAFHKEDS